MHPFMFDGSIIPRGFHLPQDYIDLLTKENLPEFSSFAVKIVMKTSDPAYVPKIQDVRAVASY